MLSCQQQLKKHQVWIRELMICFLFGLSSWGSGTRWPWFLRAVTSWSASAAMLPSFHRCCSASARRETSTGRLLSTGQTRFKGEPEPCLLDYQGLKCHWMHLFGKLNPVLSSWSLSDRPAGSHDTQNKLSIESPDLRDSICLLSSNMVQPTRSKASGHRRSVLQRELGL